jgi:glycosyltransferase involved in cell wall biosynthesis
MRLHIITPTIGSIVTGNISYAEQCRDLLCGLGYVATLGGEGEGDAAEVLIALNAHKSARAVAEFVAANPDGKTVVVLTGTDIYPDPGAEALRCMEMADRLVAISPTALEQVPEGLREKVRVILQAVSPVDVDRREPADGFAVAVVANLRSVKDPMLAAEAAKLMPAESEVRIRHAGAVLDEKYRQLAESESADNSRYQWLGGVGPGAARQLIADSDLLLLTSLSEGAGRVIGEAIVEGVPVLSTRIDGVVGLVGDDYPGLFPVGDAAALAELLWRAESDASFMDDLRQRCRGLAPQFAPVRELAAWKNLIDELR